MITEISPYNYIYKISLLISIKRDRILNSFHSHWRGFQLHKSSKYNDRSVRVVLVYLFFILSLLEKRCARKNILERIQFNLLPFEDFSFRKSNDYFYSSFHFSVLGTSIDEKYPRLSSPRDRYKFIRMTKWTAISRGLTRNLSPKPARIFSFACEGPESSIYCTTKLFVDHPPPSKWGRLSLDAFLYPLSLWLVIDARISWMFSNNSTIRRVKLILTSGWTKKKKKDNL